MAKNLLAFLAVVIFLFSFREARKVLFPKPSHFPKPEYNFKNNPLDSNATKLGRYLFFDPVLSKDSSISCASCHSPFNAFAHSDHSLSHGINDTIGRRNAPALFNLAWQNLFMWDGAINHLDVQALAPLSSSAEMGESLNHVIQKINKQTFYKKAFKAAFDSEEVSGERFLKALSQFQLTLISANSKYDRVRLGKEQFTEKEKKGYLLFSQNCGSCHSEPLFSSYEFESNFLPVNAFLNDNGRAEVTLDRRDSMKFKVPSLRNLSFSFPYMHDGRFTKLNEVLNHYTDSTVQVQFLEAINKSPIYLSGDEKVDLIAFLLTLNDKEFVFNPKQRFPKELLTKTKE